MSFILHRAGDQRFVLQSVQTGELIGLLFAPLPSESRRAFEYDFGSTQGRQEIINIADFPELEQLEFFAIDSAGAVEFERAFQSSSWAAVRSLFAAAAKAIAYHSPLKPTEVQHAGLPPFTQLWCHTPPNPKGTWKIPAWALWVNETEVWMGNRDGLILVFNHDGEPINQYHLPKNSRALAECEQGLLSICDDGQVYEFSGKLPYPICDARSTPSTYGDFRLQALTTQQGLIFTIDVYGNLTCFNPDGQMQWQQQIGVWQGWSLHADEQRVYVGHFKGITCWDGKSGQLLWTQTTPAPVLSGVLLSDRLLIGTSEGQLYSLEKAGNLKTQTTEIQLWGNCDGAVFACGLTDDASQLITADGRGNLYGFNINNQDLRSERLWKYPIQPGSVLNLQLWGDRIYGTTTDGTLICWQYPAGRVQI